MKAKKFVGFKRIWQWIFKLATVFTIFFFHTEKKIFTFLCNLLTLQGIARTGLCNTLFLFQEKFAEFHVLDAVLGLLCFINSLQLEKLNQQIKTNVGSEEQTVILETEAERLGGSETGRPADEGFITRIVSSPSENVSIGAEEGEFELCTICFILSVK